MPIRDFTQIHKFEEVILKYHPWDWDSWCDKNKIKNRSKRKSDALKRLKKKNI